MKKENRTRQESNLSAPLENAVKQAEHERDGERLSNACPNGAEKRPEASADESLVDALTMLARLPLSDAERADAVRRLLAERAVQ